MILVISIVLKEREKKMELTKYVVILWPKTWATTKLRLEKLLREERKGILRINIRNKRKQCILGYRPKWKILEN